MSARLGKNQLSRLAYMGGVHTFQIVGCKESRALQQRGLLRAHGDDSDSFFSITPAGLRALAAAIDCGRYEQPTPKPISKPGKSSE